MTSPRTEPKLSASDRNVLRTGLAEIVWNRVVDVGRALYRRLRGKPWQGTQISVPIERFGSDYGGYCVCPTELDAQSIVYSFGLGEDISFDLSIIERLGATVHAFDPTPRSVAWVKQQQLPPGFLLHEYGIADYDGVAQLGPPPNAEHVSHSVLRQGGASSAGIEVPVRKLSSILAELGHHHVDVLKMDVEGMEYPVIEDLCRSGVSVGQLLLEFHHQLKGVSLRRTERAIRRLNQAGYRVFHVSRSGREFSLVRG
jgi:FkbM family methyltransferase